MATRSPGLFHCLIRTHHITSRKKVQRVRRAASQLHVDWVLLRSGGAPGIMFGESRDASSLEAWVAAVQALRYKDFRCVVRPEASLSEALGPPGAPGAPKVPGTPDRGRPLLAAGFDETPSVSEFARQMERRGLGDWWKRAMGYSTETAP